MDAAAAVAAASPENVDDDMAHSSSAESADAAEAEAATAAGAEYCNGNTPAESKAAAVRKPPAAAARLGITGQCRTASHGTVGRWLRRRLLIGRRRRRRLLPGTAAPSSHAE